MNHKTVKIVRIERQEIDIDVKLAPLIRLLWDLDIDTCQCCQEYRPGEACIEFPGTDEVCEFLNVAQREYKVEVETWDEGENGEHSIAVRLLVFFPMKDIPDLIKAFKMDKACVLEVDCSAFQSTLPAADEAGAKKGKKKRQ
jgi:hypothetical protein